MSDIEVGLYLDGRQISIGYDIDISGIRGGDDRARRAVQIIRIISDDIERMLFPSELGAK